MPQFLEFASSIELSIPFTNCLFAGEDDSGDLIVLEDLKPYGYRMANRLKGLDYIHSKIVMQVIATIMKQIRVFFKKNVSTNGLFNMRIILFI